MKKGEKNGKGKREREKGERERAQLPWQARRKAYTPSRTPNLTNYAFRRVFGNHLDLAKSYGLFKRVYFKKLLFFVTKLSNFMSACTPHIVSDKKMLHKRALPFSRRLRPQKYAVGHDFVLEGEES